MAINYRTDTPLNQELNRGVTRSERLFKVASRSVAHLVDFGIDWEHDEFACERYFAVFWQQYYYNVLVLEPHNRPMIQSLAIVNQRVSDVLQTDTQPWELLEE